MEADAEQTTLFLVGVVSARMSLVAQDCVDALHSADSCFVTFSDGRCDCDFGVGAPQRVHNMCTT